MMNYYQHHIGDFIRDTSRLTDSQCMAYLRLIWIYYETEEPFECDIDAVAFKIGASASDVRQLTNIFFFEHNGKFHHSRCDKEILAFRDKSKKAKKSANARWDNANAMRTHTERNANAPVFDANQEPVTSNHKPIKETKESCTKPVASAPAPVPTPAETQITIPTNKNGNEFPILKTKMAEWEATFPGVDVPLTLVEIRQWCVDNPSKRKTDKGIHSFINRWLAREQNGGRYG